MFGKKKKDDDIVISESASTHERKSGITYRSKFDDKGNVIERKPHEPAIEKAESTHKGKETSQRFAKVKESFSETGERMKRGWKESRAELKEGTSYKVREKLGRLTPDERKEKLAELREQVSMERAKASIAKYRAQKQKGKDVMSYSISDPLEWYGLKSDNPPDMAQVMPQAWDGNILSIPGMPTEKQKKPARSGNIMNVGQSDMQAPSLKKLKQFYGI